VLEWLLVAGWWPLAWPTVRVPCRVCSLPGAERQLAGADPQSGCDELLLLTARRQVQVLLPRLPNLNYLSVRLPRPVVAKVEGMSTLMSGAGGLAVGRDDDEAQC
jgi:hypothetical protein